jgi:hypothetical protein
LAVLERVSSGATVTFAEGEKILNVFVLAISILTSVNDVLDDMFALGIAALFIALAAASLDVEAKALQTLLKKLLAELQKAKRKSRKPGPNWGSMRPSRSG